MSKENEQHALETMWRVAATYQTAEQQAAVLSVAGAGITVAVQLCNKLWEEVAQRPMKKRDRIQVAAQICKMFIHYEALEFMKVPDRKADDDVSAALFCQAFAKVLQRLAVDDVERVLTAYRETK
jgi:hypothetical protein